MPRTWRILFLSLILALPLPGQALAQPAGVVTALHGSAEVVRASTGAPRPLKFKDPVFVADRITTGERSLARVLLGGRALVTARERSVITITAVPGVARIDVASGKLALAVAKKEMKAGEAIEVRTRNIVVAIRGTVVVAEFLPGGAGDGSRDVTNFTVLRGLVDITPLDPATGRATAAPFRLGGLQRVIAVGAAVPKVAPISTSEARRIADGYSIPLPATPETARAAVGEAHVRTTVRELDEALNSSVASPTAASTLTKTTSATVGAVTTSTTSVLSPTSPTLLSTTNSLTTTNTVTKTTNGLLTPLSSTDTLLKP